MDQMPIYLEWACSISIVLSALVSVTRANPLYSALWLINAFLFTAVMWVVQGAVFMAFLQVLTYIGAIIVLVLFTIMLMDLRSDQQGPPTRLVPLKIVAFGATAGSALILANFFCHLDLQPYGAIPETGMISALLGGEAGWGGIRHMGWLLFREGGLFPFEFITILLLATLVGCVDICKRRSS